MSLILPGLIVGGFHESFDRDFLTAHSVTHILNVATECNVAERVRLIYFKVDLPDDCPSTDISVVFSECMDFILAAHKIGGCVFVHCLEGVSRSVCVTLCYMVLHVGWRFDQALAHVRAQRPHIDPFPRYLADTRNYCRVNEEKRCA
jgi:protein-tyrosine phosphatase